MSRFPTASIGPASLLREQGLLWDNGEKMLFNYLEKVDLSFIWDLCDPGNDLSTFLLWKFSDFGKHSTTRNETLEGLG